MGASTSSSASSKKSQSSTSTSTSTSTTTQPHRIDDTTHAPLLPGQYRDGYGVFTLGPVPEPVPPFPCQMSPQCTEDQPHLHCTRHKNVLYVHTLSPVRVNGIETTRFSIPWTSWECWYWIKLRIHEATGIAPEVQRLIFAGAQQEDFTRHSGLQYQSTITLIQRLPTSSQKPAIEEDSTL